MNTTFGSILPLGDTALIINWSNVIDENINKKVLGLFQKLRSLSLNGIVDIVPAYCSLTIHYDVFTLRQTQKNDKSVFENISYHIKKIIEEDSDEPALPTISKIKVPVCYAKKYALDINEIVKEKKISAEEIIRLHTARTYRVYMIGFLPGFAYMGEVDEKIIIPRKSQPRPVVEAGYVGIAGKQTGIYPLDSPGGWQIIGKTPLKLFNKEKDDAVLLQPGDEIEFYSITEDEFKDY